MSTAVIVQARMGSTRLPGKVLLPLCGRPMLDHQLDRLGRVQGADRIVVATTSSPGDDAICELVRRRGEVALFRGSEQDVLDRYFQAARQEKATTVVRVTSDCPLIDFSVVDACIRLFRDSGADYVSNCQQRTFPRGLDTEVFGFDVLEAAHREATAPPDREHVTPFIWRQPDRFTLLPYVDSCDRSDLRWTVDTPEDLELVTRIYDEIYTQKPDFGYADVLAVLDAHPEWREINRGVEQKQYGQ